MAVYYADSSVLSKNHLPEVGADWVRLITSTDSGNIIFTAFITQIEGVSAFNRRLREKSISHAEYSVIIEDWLLSCATAFMLVPMSTQTVDICRRLLETYPLRAYDAVQLASAIMTNQTLVEAGSPPITFLASDRRLLDAAQAEGFAVDDPNQHP